MLVGHPLQQGVYRALIHIHNLGNLFHQFITIHILLIVLESVRQKDMYGYELVEEVSKVVDVNEGTIYPLLKRMTNEHYFETYLRESTEGPPRKYYHLTAAGVLYRDSLEQEWNQLTEKVGAFLKECRHG